MNDDFEPDESSSLTFIPPSGQEMKLSKKQKKKAKAQAKDIAAMTENFDVDTQAVSDPFRIHVAEEDCGSRPPADIGTLTLTQSHS